MRTRNCICVAAVFILVGSALAASPEVASPPADSVLREEAPDADPKTIGTSLGEARGAFLEVDAFRAGAQIRRAAAELRSAAATVAEDFRASLHEAAHDLDKLAKRVEERSVESVQEMDRAFARTFHALAQHHFEMAQRSWQNREHRQAGHRLRAAADNLETAFASSGRRISLAGEEAVRESRMVSAKLVEGSGCAVDDVGRAFENLGKQIEILGARMEPLARRNPDRLVVPK